MWSASSPEDERRSGPRGAASASGSSEVLTFEDLDELYYSQEPGAIFPGLGRASPRAPDAHGGHHRSIQEDPVPALKGLGRLPPSEPDVVSRGLDRMPLPGPPEVEPPHFDALHGRLIAPSTGERIPPASPITGFVARWPGPAGRSGPTPSRWDARFSGRPSSSTPRASERTEGSSRGFSSRNEEHKRRQRREWTDMTGHTIVSLRECGSHPEHGSSHGGPATLAFSAPESAGRLWDGLSSDHTGALMQHLSPHRVARRRPDHSASFMLGLRTPSSMPASSRGSRLDA